MNLIIVKCMDKVYLKSLLQYFNPKDKQIGMAAKLQITEMQIEKETISYNKDFKYIYSQLNKCNA